MSLDDRDYMRRDPRPVGSGGSMVRRVGWLSLLGATVVLLAITAWYGYSKYIASGPAEGSLRVNINTATQAQLVTLPSIGPALANRIIARRPYTSVEGLVRVQGITEARVQQLRPWLTVSGHTRRMNGNNSAISPRQWIAQRSVKQWFFTAVGLYAVYWFLAPWWRGSRVRWRNARTIRRAQVAERRRFDGHRLE